MTKKKEKTYADFTANELFHAGCREAYKVKQPTDYREYASGINAMYKIFKEMSDRLSSENAPEQKVKLQPLEDAMTTAINKVRVPDNEADPSHFKEVIASEIIQAPEALAEVMIAAGETHRQNTNVDIAINVSEHFARVALEKTKSK